MFIDNDLELEGLTAATAIDNPGGPFDAVTVHRKGWPLRRSVCVLNVKQMLPISGNRYGKANCR